MRGGEPQEDPQMEAQLRSKVKELEVENVKLRGRRSPPGHVEELTEKIKVLEEENETIKNIHSWTMKKMEALE